ncbi:hypothetical protein IWW36_001326 [Coemansia brasiliensis]|uniref:Uncharacterized protein n=1 Tax=Coemansia brasiliensis TaxID=2650707 RepID=A0A9W8IBU0_9FUNG|nr:hypothetical protein IWW36_001326 [Coemansia brasiliensis]
MSAYTATSTEALSKYCQQVPNAIIFFFNPDASNAQDIRKRLKPLLKAAKQLGYGCVQVNSQHIADLRDKHRIKSPEGAMFFSNQEYVKHFEFIDDRVFLSDPHHQKPHEHKPDAIGSDIWPAQLPEYPPMKPDDVVDHAGGLKPDAATAPAYTYMKPDEIAFGHNASASAAAAAQPDMACQKPNLVENDGYSEAYKQYIYHKPLPQAPATLPSSQANQPSPQASNCVCTIL